MKVFHLTLCLALLCAPAMIDQADAQSRAPIDPCLRKGKLLDLDPDFCRRVGGQPLPAGTVLIDGVQPGAACFRDGQELNLTEIECRRVGGVITLRRRGGSEPTPRAAKTQEVEVVPLD